MVRAALLSLAATVIVVILAFPTPGDRVAGAEWHLLPTCIEVGLILLGGVLLSDLMNSSGASQQLADWIATTCQKQEHGIVLIVLGVTPFAESVTGFGVGVLVAVPLLRRLGLVPFRAAVVGLLGLVIVPWGALAPGTLVAARLTGVDLRQLGVLSALLSFPVILLAGTAALIIAVGARRSRTAIPELITAALALGTGVWLTNAFVAIPLAGALGSAVSVAATLLLISLRERQRPSMGKDTRRAVGPYLSLVAGLLAARAVVAILPGRNGAWAGIITSPALWLLVTCALTPRILRMSWHMTHAVLLPAVRRWQPLALTTVLFLVLGALLTVTGMSAALATAAARLGRSYLLLAPFVGALGGFLTGSNTGANAMFASSQAAAARSLGVSMAGLVAVQNVSASLATMASPPRVALAASLARDPAPMPVTAAAGAAPAGPADPPPRVAALDDADPGQVMRQVGLVDLAVLAVLAIIAVVVM
jgi:lactate permease